MLPTTFSFTYPCQRYKHMFKLSLNFPIKYSRITHCFSLNPVKHDHSRSAVSDGEALRSMAFLHFRQPSLFLSSPRHTAKGSHSEGLAQTGTLLLLMRPLRGLQAATACTSQKL